ncbi:DUF2141 domain-containing protein [Alphaproteobacteria bacterium]|nr:DUF2141 domain-containing protein [Alphaproteobacteria bacterium]
MLDSKVMHKSLNSVSIFAIFLIFQCFLTKFAYSNSVKLDLSTLNIDTFNDLNIIIEGYERKFSFQKRNIPLVRHELLTNEIENIVDIQLLSQTYIGFFAYIDLNNDKKFNFDFKMNPLEPYGFSLNPIKQYKQIKFEDIVIDISVMQQPLKINIIQNNNLIN